MDGNRQKLYKLSEPPPAQTIFTNTTQTTSTSTSTPKGDINNNTNFARTTLANVDSLSEHLMKTGANKMSSSTSATLPSIGPSTMAVSMMTKPQTGNVSQIQIHKSSPQTSNTLPILSSNAMTGNKSQPNVNPNGMSSSTSTLPSAVNVVRPSDVVFNISNSTNDKINANSKQSAPGSDSENVAAKANNDDTTTDNEDDTRIALKSTQTLSGSKSNVNLTSNENDIKIVRKSNGKSLFKNLFCCFSATHRNSNGKRNFKNGTLPNTTIPNENYNLDSNNNNNNTTSSENGVSNNKDAQANSNLLEISPTSNELDKTHDTSTANNNKVSVNNNNNVNNFPNKNTETRKSNSANTLSINNNINNNNNNNNTNNNTNLNNSLNENINKINSLTLNSTNVSNTPTNNTNSNNINSNSNQISANYVNNIIASVSPNMNTANTSYISANYFSNDMPHFINEKNLLPPVRPSDIDKKCLIIDLDETLVHSSFKQVHNADFVVPVEIDGQIHQVYVLKRPYVDEFLKKMGELYECVLFTASLAKYADPVADRLDKWGVFRARLFREACVYYRGNYVKDLSRLGRDLKKVIILDNSPASYIFHPDNAISCTSWFEDMHDTELHDLIPYFERLSTVDNIYTFLKQSNNNMSNNTNSLINHNHPGLVHNQQPYSYIHLHNQSTNLYHHLQQQQQQHQHQHQPPQHLPIHQQPNKNSPPDDNQQVPNMQSIIYQQQQQQNDPNNTSNTLSNLNYLLNENKILLSIDLMMATKQQQLNQAQQQQQQQQQHQSSSQKQ